MTEHDTDRPICGRIGPRGTTCIEPRGHRDSHGDGTVLRWLTRDQYGSPSDERP